MAITTDISRRLPIGFQSFEDLRKSGCLYVDKTDYVYFLANSGTKSYFLARPRRFGKSLFANTLKAYFLGRKECFEGLKIYNYEKEWIKYPMAYFDFVDGDYSDPNVISKSIMDVLIKFEIANGIENDEKVLSTRFLLDLAAVHKKTGLSTVIIVDNYDQPLVNCNDNEAVGQIYGGFFSVLKSADKYIRFSFITGETKIGLNSFFYRVNCLCDVSYSDKFSSICGMTSEELVECFSTELKRLAEIKGLTFNECLERLSNWCGGYKFSKNADSVFSTESVLNVFDHLDFQLDGSFSIPESIVSRIMKSNCETSVLKDGFGYPIDFLHRAFVDVSSADIAVLLYYTGYLTIKKYDARLRRYTLGFPNNEIELSFLKLFKVGVNFSSKEKNIVEWKVAEK